MTNNNIILGAVIGDTAGSRFEGLPTHVKGNFELLPLGECSPTDDSIMTIAIEDAIMQWDDEGRPSYERLSELAVNSMRKWGRKYPYAGYANRFEDWLFDESIGPYGSCGNGSAMRVSPVGWAADTLEECIAMSKAVTEVTHNHPDGIKGAEATAVQIFLLRNGLSLSDLKKYEQDHYYKIEYDVDYLKKYYVWHSLCDGTCQAAFECAYEAKSYEEAIRNCIWSGGDCDTTAAIAGSIAEAAFGIPKELQNQIKRILDKNLLDVLKKFSLRYRNRKSSEQINHIG